MHVKKILLALTILSVLVSSGCVSNQSSCPEDTTPYKECNSCCSPCPIYKDTTPFSECDSCCTEDTTPYAECNSCCSVCPPTQQESLLRCEESLEQCETEINSMCYKNNMISQLQAENTAKHYALLQTKHDDQNITLPDIKLWGSGAGHAPSKVGNRDCNPDWMVILHFNDTKNDKCYWYIIRIYGKIENESMQGRSNLPDDYVLGKIAFEWNYGIPISECPYVGGGGIWH